MKNIFLLPIRCLLFLMISVLISSISKMPYHDISKWWTSVALVCNFITIIILYFYCRRNELTYTELINYKKSQMKVSRTILIVLLVIAIGVVGLYLAGFICYGSFPYLDKTMIEPIPIWLIIIVTLFLPISTTIAEDGLYLGYAIHNNVQQKKWNVLLSAFFYAFQHSFIPFFPDGKFILYRFLSFLPLTIFICVWYEKKRNPLPIMIGHFILNIATSIQIWVMVLNPNIFNAI